MEAAIASEERLAGTLEALDEWSRHGVLLVSVALQGPHEGHNAFQAEGALKAEWEARLDRLLAAADQREMIVKLVLFHENQDQHFDSAEALVAAARNLTDALIARDRRNVILSVATHWNSREWDHDAFVPQRLEHLADVIRDRFQVKRCDYILPLAISTEVRLAENSELVKTADVLEVHGDGAGMDTRKFERPEIVLAEPVELDVPPLAERAAGLLYSAAPDANPSDVTVAAERIAQWVLAKPPRRPADLGAK